MVIVRVYTHEPGTGEFERDAQRIAEIIHELSQGGGVQASQIPEIVSSAIGRCAGSTNRAIGRSTGKINIYPSTHYGDCCDMAFFVSLTLPSNGADRGGGHLSCRKAIEKLVQHMQGYCPEKTKTAVFITDRWNPAAYEDWKENILRIKANAHVEAYLLIGRNVSKLKI